ncbi:MAG: LptF/LptG family permease, partial [candidate division Zixibacteria bacterium]
SREAHARVSRVVRQISPGNFYTMSSFNSDRGEGNDFKLYNTEGGQASRIVAASKIAYLDFKWIAIEGSERRMDGVSADQFLEFDSLVIDQIEDKPSDLAKRIGKPEDMSLADIKYYIDLMKRTGAPHVRESVHLELKYAYPLTSAIVVLICIPFASNPRRGGLAVSIAAGTVIALLYFVAFRIMQSAGYSEKVPVMVAAWGVNAVFLLVGSVLMITARK